MSGLTEEEKAMIQSVMMKAQEFEKGTTPTMPGPKPPSQPQLPPPSTQGLQSRPTASSSSSISNQSQQNRFSGGPGGGESGFQSSVGGVNQTTSGSRLSGSNQPQPSHLSSDSNFGMNQPQQQVDQRQQQPGQLPLNQSQSINQQIRPLNQQQQQPQQLPPLNQQIQNQNLQNQQNLQQELLYQNGTDMGQMKPQPQDFYQQQQQQQPQQQSKDNLLDQQQEILLSNNNSSQQFNQQGMGIQNQSGANQMMRNQANQDQSVTNYNQQSQQAGRQQPQIPQGQQQQLNQPQQQLTNQLNQQQPPSMNQENGFMFSNNNQPLQGFSMSMDNNLTKEQQSNCLNDETNQFNGEFNGNENGNQLGMSVNPDGTSIMFEQSNINCGVGGPALGGNNSLDQEQLNDSYGPNEMNSNQLLQDNNFSGNNMNSMDTMYQNSPNRMRNDLINSGNNSGSNQFNQRDQSFGNQQQQQFINDSGFQSKAQQQQGPNQQQQSNSQMNMIPNHSSQMQQHQNQQQNRQSLQQQQQPFPGSTMNNQLPPQQHQQQTFPMQSDQQFSLQSQSQLPNLPPQQLGTSASKLSNNQQQLSYPQQQQGTGLNNKPAFLDPASLFSQDNKSNNLIQSNSLSTQNPMIQTSSSTTIPSTGTFNRHLPGQGEVMQQNQMKSNMIQQQPNHNLNQFQPQSQHLNQQQQQPFQQPIHSQQHQQSGQSIQQQLYQETSSYPSNQFDQSMSFMRSNDNQINREFQDYQEGIQADQLNQQLQGGRGIQGQHQLMTSNSMGMKGSPVTYQQPSQQLNQQQVHQLQQQQHHLHQQSMENSFSDTNRFVSPYQSTNNSPSNINVIRGSMRPNLLQGKSSDTSLSSSSSSSPLTGLIPRTVPLQSVRDQLLLSSSPSIPTASSNVVSTSSIVIPNHQQSINNNLPTCISSPTQSTSSSKHKISSSTPSHLHLHQHGNELGSTTNSSMGQELNLIPGSSGNNNLITSNQQQLVHSNSTKNSNNSMVGPNPSVPTNSNSYTQQLIHAQQLKRMEIGDCWSPVSELSPIQDVSPSVEAAEQRSMQLHQQLTSQLSSSAQSSNIQPSSSSSIIHSNSQLNKHPDEFGNGLPRVTSGTISGMLADFNKQMEALGTVSPTDDRSIMPQHSFRRSSLSRLPSSSSSAPVPTTSTIEARSRSGSLTVTSNASHPLSYTSLLSSLQQQTTTTTTATTTSTSSTIDSVNLIKSLQPSLRSSSTSAITTTTTTTSAIPTHRITTKSSAEAAQPTKSSTTSDAITSSPAINGSSILVTPSNLQLLAQSLPPAQLAIPRTVTHQVELAVSPVVEQTLQQQQMLIQQQQQLIMLQKELYQQQQEQRQKQEQLQKEQEKTQKAKAKQQQSTENQSQSSQASSTPATTSSGPPLPPQQIHPTMSIGHHHLQQQQRQAQTISSGTATTTSISSSVVTSSSHHRHAKLTGTSSAPTTPNRKDRRRLPQPTIEEMQGAVQAISNQTSASAVHHHASSLTTSKAATLSAVSGASPQLFGNRPISPIIPRKNQVIGVPIIPPMSRSRPTPATTTLTMATPTLVSSSIATASSLFDHRHGLSASSLGLIRGVSPSSMLDETQSETGGLKNKRRLPLVPLDEEPVTAAAVSRRLIKDRLMSKSIAGNFSSKSVPILRSASSLDHTPSGYLGGLGHLTKEAPGAITGLPLGRSRPHSGPISPFSSLSDIANLINSSASGLAGLDLHRPHTPTLHSNILGVGLPSHTATVTATSHLPTSTLANYLGINVPGSVSGIGPSGLSPYGLTQKSPFVTSSLPSNSPLTSPLGGALGLGGGYIKSLKSQLKDELRSVVDERRRLLDAREMARDKQDLYRRSETDLQALYDVNSYDTEALLARRGLLNRRRPLGGLRRGDTLDPKVLGPGYASSVVGDFTTGGLAGMSGLTSDLFKSYEYEFLDPGVTSNYPGLLATSVLTAGKSPFGGPAANSLRRPMSSLGALGSGLNPTDMAYGLRGRMTNGEMDPGLRESFIPNFMDSVGDGGRLLGPGAGAGRFRRRSEGSLDETLFNSDPYNQMSLSGVRGYDDLRTNLNNAPAGLIPNSIGAMGPNDRYRARPLLGSIGPAHSWHPSPYGSEDEDDKMTREEKAARVKAEIARRRAQLMETGRAVADDLGGGGKLHVGPSGHHPSYYSRDQTQQQYSLSAYRRQGGAGVARPDDYSPSSYINDYYGPNPNNRCVHGSPTHVRRSRLTRDGLYSRSLDTGYEDYTTGSTHPHSHQLSYDDYGYYNRANPGGNGINRLIPNEYQANYSGHNVPNHNQPSQGQPIPAIKRPKYPFPVKRILLIRDPKERAHGGNCYGLRLIGGQEIPGTDHVGTFVEKTITGGAVDSLGEIREGDQVLEWNGLPLTGLSNEEVQRLVTQSSNAEEVELVIRRDFNLFDIRYDYNAYNQCQVGPTETDYYTTNNSRGQMQQQVTTGNMEGQYYQSP